MKAKQRHELHTNELAEWIEDSVDKLAPYARLIGAIAVAVGILAIVYWYIGASERRAKTEASNQLIAALQAVDTRQELQVTITNHPGTQPAMLAELLLAEQSLTRGDNLLYVDKPRGRDLILQAVDAFRSAGDATSDVTIKAWSKFGLGRAYESLGDLKRAKDELERAIADDPDGAIAVQARKHIDTLAQQSTKEFYDWFAKQDPRPAPSTTIPGPAGTGLPGTPGVKPSFEAPGTSPGDVKLPSSFDPTPTSESSGPSLPDSGAPQK